MNNVLAFNALGEEIDQRIHATLDFTSSNTYRMMTVESLREINREATRIVTEVIDAAFEKDPPILPSDIGAYVCVVINRERQSVLIIFHPFVLAVITEQYG